MRHVPSFARTLRLTTLAAICCFAIPAGAVAQTPARTDPAGPPAVLWREPGPISARDPVWGFGEASRTPQGPFTFVEEDMDGTQAKVTVTDAAGTEWDVKLGHEAPAEVASNRFLWLLGYLGEEMYLVREGVIRNARGLERAAEHIGADGTFRNARFRRRDPQASRTDEKWTFHDNPFLGTPELSGLLIVMNLINNWDIRGAENNRVLDVTLPGGRPERWYIVSDLGGTFGRMGGPLGRRSKWNLQDYIEEDFIESVKDGQLTLDHEGFGKGEFGVVPLEHARWFAALAGQITVAQLRRLFEAAGATPEEVDGYSTRLSAKISELQAAVR